MPGSSGNPAGKPPGTRSLATRLSRLLKDGELEAIERGLIESARAGNLADARFLLQRLEPPPRDRTITWAHVHAFFLERYRAASADLAKAEIALAEGSHRRRLLEAERSARRVAALAQPAPTRPAGDAPVRPQRGDAEPVR